MAKSADIKLEESLTLERKNCENHLNNYTTPNTQYARLEAENTQSMGILRGKLKDSRDNLTKILSKKKFQEGFLAKAPDLGEQQKLRCDCSKLRYDCSLLKAQLHDQKDDHARILEKNILREAELSCLAKEKNDLVALREDLETLNVETQKDNDQLCRRLKGLEAEVAGIHGQKVKFGQQMNLQNRQQTESQAALKSAEAENQSLRQQLERMQRELCESCERNNQLNGRLYKAEREVSSLTNQIESLKHSHQLELCDMKLECTRSKRDMVRERDTLQGQIEEVSLAAVEQHKGVLVGKEREMVRKVQSTREEESRKFTGQHDEKLELVDRLDALEEKSALQGRLRSAQRGEESARRELQNLRTKLQQQSCQHEEIERQRAETSGLQQQNEELSVQLGRLTHSDSDLRETLERVREELRTARAGEERLEGRDAKLQQKYSDLKDKLQRAAEAQKKKEALTETNEKKLLDKIQLLEAKSEELKLEVVAAQRRSGVPQKEHAKLHRQLNEQQQRHNQFEHLLFNTQPVDFMTPSVPCHGSLTVLGNTPEKQQQTDLTQIYQRIENLAKTQRQQQDQMDQRILAGAHTGPQHQ